MVLVSCHPLILVLAQGSCGHQTKIDGPMRNDVIISECRRAFASKFTTTVETFSLNDKINKNVMGSFLAPQYLKKRTLSDQHLFRAEMDS